jgi:hypothetical protein
MIVTSARAGGDADEIERVRAEGGVSWTRFDHVKKLLTFLLSPDEGHGGHCKVE